MRFNHKAVDQLSIKFFCHLFSSLVLIVYQIALFFTVFFFVRLFMTILFAYIDSVVSIVVLTSN